MDITHFAERPKATMYKTAHQRWDLIEYFNIKPGDTYLYNAEKFVIGAITREGTVVEMHTRKTITPQLLKKPGDIMVIMLPKKPPPKKT